MLASESMLFNENSMKARVNGDTPNTAVRVRNIPLADKRKKNGHGVRHARFNGIWFSIPDLFKSL
jgi:hypothetical protein